MDKENLIDRIQDIEKIIDMRGEKIYIRHAEKLIMMHCYYNMQIKGCQKAVKESMELNNNMKRSLPFETIERILGLAIERYQDSLDEEKNEEAKANGYPGAGLNYTTTKLKKMFGVTTAERKQLKTM